MRNLEAGRIFEAEKAPQVYALCLFVTDERGDALIFQNNVTKESTQKVKGQLTVPAETIEPGENLRRDSLPRTIAEEVGFIREAPEPKFRGVGVFNTPEVSFHLVCLEVQTTRAQVHINPKDDIEVSNPRWVPISEIDRRTMRIGSFDVPLYRTPIPQLAENIAKAREGQKIPAKLVTESRLPKELFDFLKVHPGPIHPVK